MGTLLNKSNEILNEKTTKIIPENIKEGVQIFDIVGTYSGSAVGGDVKRFDTIEEMQADETAQEGDLAVVYLNQQSNLTENAVFSKIILPETVVLDTAVEDYIEIGFQPVDESVEMDCWGNLDSNMMNVDIYMPEGTNYRIQYEGQDGITYTRSNETPNEIDFGFDVQFGNRWGEAQWDDRIGQFFSCGELNFGGLYIYKDNNYIIAPNQLTATTDNMLPNKTAYSKDGIIIGNDNIYNNLDELKIKQKIFGGELKNYNNGLILVSPNIESYNSNILNTLPIYLKKCQPNEHGGYYISTLKKIISITDDIGINMETSSSENNKVLYNDYLEVFIISAYSNNSWNTYIVDKNYNILRTFTGDFSDIIYNYKKIIFYCSGIYYVYDGNTFATLDLDLSNTRRNFNSYGIFEDRYLIYNIYKLVSSTSSKYNCSNSIIVYDLDTINNGVIDKTVILNDYQYSAGRDWEASETPRSIVLNFGNYFKILFYHFGIKYSLIEYNKINKDITSSDVNGVGILGNCFEEYCLEDDNYFYLLGGQAKLSKSTITDMTRITCYIEYNNTNIEMYRLYNNEIKSPYISRNYYYRYTEIQNNYKGIYELGSLSDIEYDYNNDICIFKNCKFITQALNTATLYNNIDLNKLIGLNDSLGMSSNISNGIVSYHEIKDFALLEYDNNTNNYTKIYIYDKPIIYKESTSDFDTLVFNNCEKGFYYNYIYKYNF